MAHNALTEVSFVRDRVPDPELYPFTQPLIKNLETISIESDVCLLVGENGSGKSTLIEAIARNYGLSAQGGSQNMRLPSAGDGIDELAEALSLTWRRKLLYGYFLRAESFFNVATLIDELGVQGSHGGASLHEQSHGESFLAVIQHRFWPDGFYLLDEPESALSPLRQLSLLVVLQRLRESSKHLQILIATHSPIGLALPNAQILSLDGGSVREIAYEETQAYQIYETFIRDRAAYLHRLFEGT